MTEKKRYALVGTGSRAGMFVDAITTTYRDTAELVAFCDLSLTRMKWYNQQMRERPGVRPAETYLAADFDRMVAETKPDTVIVTTIDATHHIYIVRAMELGCDAIKEKPMTTDIGKMTAIYDAIDRTGRSLRVTFNYRYAPAYTRFRELIMEGKVGRPLAVDFTWVLDTSHGADYFRRWHREKHNSGGLLVHKATHHFDLVNWWIDSYPAQVFAMGDLLFYGKPNAEARGEHYPYERYTGEPAAEGDPFALFLDHREQFRGMYLDAEDETGYLRDRNVFGEPITIEDTLCVTVRYRNGALLSYNLVAYSPWEGLRVAVTGTKGRIETDIVENTNHLHGGGQASASKGAFKQAQMRVPKRRELLGWQYLHSKKGYKQLDNVGQTKHLTWNQVDCRQHHAHLDHNLQWIIQSGDVWLSERRAIAISTENASDGEWSIAIQMEFQNVSGESIQIGSPLTRGRPLAGYGGLFWRGPRSFTGANLFSAEHDGEDIVTNPNEWVAFTGPHDGTGHYSTVIFIDSPSNPRYPTKWWGRNERFACISSSFVYDEIYDLKPDDALRLRYWVVICNGARNRDEVSQVVKRYRP